MLPPSRAERLEDWSFAPVWVRDDAELDAAVGLQGTWLVLGDTGPLSRAVRDKISSAGGRAVLLERGNSFKGTAMSFTVRSDSAEDIATVLRHLQEEGRGPVAGAIHLWAVTQDEDAVFDAEQVYKTLVTLGVALGTSVQSTVRLIHACVGMETVLNEARRKPRAALAVGPLLVLPAEYPNLRMTAIDLDNTQDGRIDMHAAAVALAGEAARADRTVQSAWRGGRRWLKRYERISLPPAAQARLPLKHEGVYLITGALGGIGLTLACWLASRYQARLLLTSRSGRVTEQVAAALRTIESAGGEALVVAADAADEAAMSAAIAQASARWGWIDGVIHAAGIAGAASLIPSQTFEQAHATFQPKLAGLEVLVKILGEVPLDFVALMSSISSVVGTAGLCDYSAANAVLDAFASGTARPAAWRHVVSINWDAWRDVGMAANVIAPEEHRARWQAFLATAIPPAMGVEAFARALASRRARVVITPYDLLQSIRFYEFGAAAAASAEDLQTQPGQVVSDLAPRAAQSAAYDAPELDLERRLAVIWSDLLGVDLVGRQDNFFQLGGHSLLATRVLARVQQSFGVRLELRDVFDAPTLEQMAEKIARNSGAVSVTNEDREEIEF